ncbi:MAG TPA: hypothetical protein VJ505_11135 [Holophagaceae bacterium]|nr:hypothetical protein [Holophagaceae bacterium]
MIPLPPAPALVAPQAEPALVEIARSGFDMKGTPFSRARLSLDVAGFRKAMAAPGRPGEDPMAKALRVLREGQVRFHIWQGWEIAVSGSRRREFNLQVVGGVWPQGVPPAMQRDLGRYLAYVTRDADIGQHWEFRGGGGRPLRGRYNDEPWTDLGRGAMTALIVGLYFEGGEAVPGTRVDFREGLRFLITPPAQR